MGARVLENGMPERRAMSYASFKMVRDFFRQKTGIVLRDAQQELVTLRLGSRVGELGFGDFDDYAAWVIAGVSVKVPTLPDSHGSLINAADEARARERELWVESLTTHETYFFRESDQFEHFQTFAADRASPNRDFTVWSAACSSGEEPYSLAMVLADTPAVSRWTVFGSDIAPATVRGARRGHYLYRRMERLPEGYLQRFFLRGKGPQRGTVLVRPEVRHRCRFEVINLTEPMGGIGSFDAIFLRNVLIYFQPDMQQVVAERVLNCLRPGGLLFVGASESLQGMGLNIEMVGRGIYKTVFGGQ